MVTSLHDLTLAVVSLQQEAEPVGHIVVGGKPTPRGAAEAGRRAKRPVAPISLLMEQNEIKPNKALHRNKNLIGVTADGEY